MARGYLWKLFKRLDGISSVFMRSPDRRMRFDVLHRPPMSDMEFLNGCDLGKAAQIDKRDAIRVRNFIAEWAYVEEGQIYPDDRFAFEVCVLGWWRDFHLMDLSLQIKTMFGIEIIGRIDGCGEVMELIEHPTMTVGSFICDVLSLRHSGQETVSE